MSIKLCFALSVFLILISISQAANNEDLVVAETAIAKKAITGAAAMKAGEKGVLVGGKKKLAKGVAVGKAFGTKKAGFKAGKIDGLGAFKKKGKKAGFLAKGGVKKMGAKKLGFNKLFAVKKNASFGKFGSFGKKSGFAIGKTNGFMKSVGGLKAGGLKKGGLASGLKAGVKKVSKGGKVGGLVAKGGKIGGLVKVANGVGFKKGAMVGAKVAGAKKMIAGKGVKG